MPRKKTKGQRSVSKSLQNIKKSTRISMIRKSKITRKKSIKENISTRFLEEKNISKISKAAQNLSSPKSSPPRILVQADVHREPETPNTMKSVVDTEHNFDISNTSNSFSSPSMLNPTARQNHCTNSLIENVSIPEDEYTQGARYVTENRNSNLEPESCPIIQCYEKAVFVSSENVPLLSSSSQEDILPLSRNEEMVENYSILIATEEHVTASVENETEPLHVVSFAQSHELLENHPISLISTTEAAQTSEVLHPFVNALPVIIQDNSEHLDQNSDTESQTISIFQNPENNLHHPAKTLQIPTAQLESPVLLKLCKNTVLTSCHGSDNCEISMLPDLPISQDDLECTLQFEQSRCSHIFSGLSNNVSRIDSTIQSGNSVEIVVENNDIIQNVTKNTNDSTKSNLSVTIDKDYLPVQSSSANTSTEQQSEAHMNNKGRPKRGRKRKYPGQNRAEKKAKLNKGKEYINSKGETIKQKTFLEGFQCGCKKKCTEKVSEELRKKIFTNYWEAGSFEARCAILQGYCKEITKSSCRRNSKKRSFTRQYNFYDISVCKLTFLKTLSISQKPIDTALAKARKIEPVTDKRGKSGGHNKLSEEKVQEVVNFIKALPKYKSHYCDNHLTKYLSPQLNLALVYDLYKERHSEHVSKSSFKNIFYARFNLRFKKPQKDTCNRCDVFKIKKQNSTGTELEKIESEHKVHLNRARALRELMKKDMKKASEDLCTETLTYDLEKTNCLPRLLTNIIYYKRQLNLYNFGIHQSSNNQGYIYVWLEYEGGRGTQEVGCCLKKFISSNLPSTTTKLILWADSCGGQNKSIKLVLILMHILLNHETLQKITMRYLQPGHTFLPNDAEFGDLECALKTHNRLYTDEDYINVMKSCRRKNKFIINRFHKEDFLSVEPLLKAITNRKKDINKQKVSWQKASEISFLKSEPFKLFFKCDVTSDTIQEVNIAKAKNPRNMSFKDIEMPPLYPNGRDLSSAKVKDLKDMLNLIPKDAKKFYDFLKSSTGVDYEDDVDGHGQTIDFDMLDDDYDN